MNILPQAKNAELVVQDLGKELLIYDLKTNNAFTLNETLMIVFNACDGKTSFDQLQRRHKFTEDLIYLSLDILKDQDLLASDYQSKFAGISRREVIKKVGLACAVALPVIAGMAAPQAAQAASAASTSCRSVGVCIPPNRDVCAGCAGRTFNYTFYSSTNGSCSTNPQNGSFTCPTVSGILVPTIADFKINSIT